MATVFSILFLLGLAALIPLLAVFLVRRLMKKPVRAIKWYVLGDIILILAAFIVLWCDSVRPTTPSEPTIQTALDFEVCDRVEPLEVETYLDHSALSNRIYVFDSDYLFLIYDHGDVTTDMLREAIDENPGIGSDYKPYFHLFLERVTETYPNASLDTLYHNLLSLEVVPCDERDLMEVTWSLDTYGCYVRDENRIYVLSDYVYEEGTWAFQVMFHEIAHAMRSSRTALEPNGFYDASPGLLYNVIADEALNSVFAVSLFDYEERDVAYQLPSNYLQIMLECMDNYTLADYINHSQTYFYHMLDLTTGHNNYAQVIWELIEFQRTDREDDYIQIPQEEYHPIYDYLCAMYYPRNITPDMTAEEARAVADKLVERVTYDVPEDFNLDTGRFYTNLESYLAGISAP